MPSVSLHLQYLAGVGGGRHRRCGGRTTPSPTPCCCSSLCTGVQLLAQIAHRERQAAGTLLTVKIRQPSHEFTFGVGMTFVSYPLVLTPVV
jgi:hypothetical protein